MTLGDPGTRAPHGRHAISVRSATRADSVTGDESEEGVDGGFERASVTLDLGEEEASLEGGEEGDGQVVRAGAGREVPGGAQAPQPVADGG
jgi:hypothetical protein